MKRDGSSAKNIPPHTLQRPNGIQLENRVVNSSEKNSSRSRCDKTQFQAHREAHFVHTKAIRSRSALSSQLLDNFEDRKPFSTPLLFTQISFDQNINFADENWVTFRFMQLDNVQCFSNQKKPRAGLRLRFSRFTYHFSDPLEVIQQKKKTFYCCETA